MIPVPRRVLHAVSAVVDVALHARPAPVNAKALAARHELPPRHLEAVLQALVRAGILKGMRGPRGGYELGRDRRHISVGDIVRAVEGVGSEPPAAGSDRLVDQVVVPAMAEAGAAFMLRLDQLSVADLCRRAGPGGSAALPDFTI